MTIIQKQSLKLATSLVNKLWATHWVYDERSFESAKSAAVIVARIMMKEYKDGFSVWIYTAGVELKDKFHYQILKALPKSIYSLKYKKK